MPVISHLIPTHLEADSLVFNMVGKRFTYDHANIPAGLTVMFPIPAGTTVLGVSHRVITAFDNGADLDVGDSADADGYLTQAILTPTTLNDFACSIGNAAAYGKGKYYAASNYILLTFTALPTVGAGEVIVWTTGQEE